MLSCSVQILDKYKIMFKIVFFLVLLLISKSFKVSFSLINFKMYKCVNYEQDNNLHHVSVWLDYYLFLSD